ncbi:glycosyltransferase family 2 protein [Agromyces sp. CF514]|uniref:glycosyltransferase family 2 protein n=1 Tax=Agromyces sp. CF514 TaxID=1881031 RepID=UPI000B832CC4|nr:glycosyltransferase family 2 protein [Agromyces sp. CF514]
MNERTPPPRVLVVTVSYGSDAVLPGLLESVADATSQPVRIVVADNLGTESVRTIAADAGAEYLALPNPGYGGAVNAAVRAFGADTEWVLVVNPDVTLGATSIDRLLAAADDAAIGSIGPLITDEDGTVYPSARQLPRLLSGTGHAALRNIWPGNPFTAAYRRSNEAPVPRDAEWLSGACVLVRRSAFDEIDGFDDGFFMYFEDVDLGARLLDAGYRNRYEPHASVVHTGAHSTEKSLTAMTRAHHDSAYRFLEKRYHGWWLWPLRQVLRVGLGVRARMSAH